MPTEPDWLDPREDRAWRAFKHVAPPAHPAPAPAPAPGLRTDRGRLRDPGRALGAPHGPYARAGTGCPRAVGEEPALPPGPAHARTRADRPRTQPRRRPQRHDLPSARRTPRHRGRSAPARAQRPPAFHRPVHPRRTRHPCRPQRTSPAPPRRGTFPRNPLPASPRSRTERPDRTTQQEPGSSHTARTVPQRSPAPPGPSAPRPSASIRLPVSPHPSRSIARTWISPTACQRLIRASRHRHADAQNDPVTGVLEYRRSPQPEPSRTAALCLYALHAIVTERDSPASGTWLHAYLS